MTHDIHSARWFTLEYPAHLEPRCLARTRRKKEKVSPLLGPCLLESTSEKVSHTCLRFIDRRSVSKQSTITILHRALPSAMANQGNPGHFSPTDLTDEASSSADERQTPRASTQRDSIRHYVNAVLLRHGGDEEQQPSTLNRSRIQIDTRSSRNRDYENLSAFRQYSSGTGQRANAQQRRQESGSISDENDDDPPRRAAAAATPTERVGRQTN